MGQGTVGARLAVVVAVIGAALAMVGGAAPAPVAADGNEAPGAPAGFRQLSAGSNHTCAILSGGSVKCWGQNDKGQLGLGDTDNRGDAANEMGANLPTVDLGIGRTAVAISAGTFHTCALLDNGSVKCWGNNQTGELGLGDTVVRGDETGEMGDNLPAVDLGTGRTAVAVSASQQYTCALLDNATVKCWGYGFLGKLGQGDTTNRGDGPGEMGDNLPAVDLGTGRTAVAVATGSYHVCALLDHGSVKCWGQGGAGALGNESNTNRGDGPNEMGDNLPAAILGTGRTATAITAGSDDTCALLDNGSVKCWGQGNLGQLGQGNASQRGSTPGSMGDNLPAVALGTGRTAVAVRTKFNHTCAVLDNGSLKCWGWNVGGQLGLGDTVNRGDLPDEMGDALPAVDVGTGRTVLAVTTGLAHTCARLDDGSLKCWGYNTAGSLGTGDGQSRGDGPNEMGDSLPVVSLVAPAPAPPTGTAGYRQLSAGTDHSCAILPDGSVKCWGKNTFGQLGLGDTANRGAGPGEMGNALPAVDLGTGRTAVAISAGLVHTCALLDDGSVKCWGGNTAGELGRGDTAARGDGPGEMGDDLPAVDLGTGRTAVALSAGSQVTCAVLDNGSVKCWGTNNRGQLGQGDTANRGVSPGQMGDSLPAIALGTGRTATAVAVGATHVCAVLDNGSLKCWGSGTLGELGTGDHTNRGDGPGEMGDNLPAVDLGTGRTAVAVDAGSSVTCALLDDGSVKCWGFGTVGTLGQGDTTDRGDGPGEMGDALPAVPLGTGRTAVSLSVGAAHACAGLDDGSVRCWGWNGLGQLGLGDTDNRGDGPGEMGDALPAVSLGTGRHAVAVAGGGSHTCARLDDGSVKCWGSGDIGRLGLGDSTSRGDGPGEMGDALPRVQLVTPAPAMSVVVTSDESSVAAGATIHTHATITNTGNVGLTGLTVSTAGCAAPPAVLLPGDHPVVDCTHVATARDISSYAASVTADSDQTNAVTSNTVNVSVTIPAGRALVKGQVTAVLFGNPVSGVLVAALDPVHFTVLGLDVTDAGGNYAMVTPAGSYLLYRADPLGGHIAGFHAPTPSTVGDGQTVSVNTQMNRSTGGIEGRITDAAGGDGIPSGLALTSNAATGTLDGGAATDGFGFYVARNLRSVPHLVTLLDLAGGHVPQYFNGAVSPANATPVNVVGGASQVIGTSTLAAQTAPGGAAHLQGTVKGLSNAAVPGIAVVALNASTYSFEAGALTNGSGQYDISVDPGNYLLGFADPSGAYQFEWNLDQPASGLGSATPVTASVGSPTTVNANLLSNRGGISGYVTEDGSGDALEGVWAFAIDATGSVVGVGRTGADGTFTIGGVPVGPVRVRFYDITGAHVPEYWDDHGGASGSDGYMAATVVTVTGHTTSFLSAGLAPTS